MDRLREVTFQIIEEAIEDKNPLQIETGNKLLVLYNQLVDSGRLKPSLRKNPFEHQVFSTPENVVDPLSVASTPIYESANSIEHTLEDDTTTEFPQPFNYADDIRSRIFDMGLTHKQVAEDSGISTQTLNSIINHLVRNPRPTTVRAINQSLDRFAVKIFNQLPSLWRKDTPRE